MQGYSSHTSSTHMTEKSVNHKASPDGRDVSVDHEWGTLKEVVVGLTNVRVPSKVPNTSKNYLPESSIEFIEKNRGQWLQECEPDLNQQSIDQINSIISILRDRGIIVHQVEKLSDAETNYLAADSDAVMQTFPRDPILVIGNKVIETSMLEPYRRKERFAIRRTIEKRLQKVGLFWYPCHSLTLINPDQLATMDLDHTLKEGMLCWSGKIFM